MSEKYTPYRALAVANYFIENTPSITPLKLQKLVYFAHGWYLAYTDGPLIIEPVECWEYGPVIREIYDNFKMYGNQVIIQKAEDLVPSKGEVVFPFINKDDEFTKELLDIIINVYGKLTAIQLSNETHKEKTPWDIVNNQGGDIIDNELIKEHFGKKLEAIESEQESE